MSGVWLIERSVFDALEHARRTMQVTPEQLAEFTRIAAAESVSAAADEPRPPRGVRVNGTTAQIDVTGVLTKRPNFWAYFFGGGNTTYSGLLGAVAYAEARADVEEIEFLVESPGGQVDGLFEAIAGIQASQKPKRVMASLAASAAYAIAAVAGPIQASSPSSTFGSIGVVATYYVEDGVVEITSTNAPAKRPDVRTDDGKAIVRAYLDELEGLFLDAVATGRGVSVDRVKREFGAGAVFAAGEAERRGMINGVTRPKPRAVGAANNTPSPGGERKATAMDLKTLRAQHPELATALLEEGANAERERVTAFLELAAQAGEAGMKQAVTDIKGGAAASAAKAMSYVALALNKRDQDNHEADSKKGEEATKGAETGAKPARDLGDQLADALGAPALKAN